jgi:Predicted membrane protein
LRAASRYRAVIRRDPGALGSLVAHGILLGGLTVASGVALLRITLRLQSRDDIVEPAYPEPPISAHVSAGPASTMPFESIGKEGRRFVLMTLTPDEITAVMGEPAIEPVRVVGGFESTSDIAERAKLTLADLESCGGFDRGLICVASPTGVGYVNYTIIEALEYLTRGDCATVVPQYALVPSALAMPRTAEGVHLTRLVLEGIRDRISAMPADQRPRVLLMGESLGANVALDVSTVPGPYTGIPALDHLGVDGGVYFGVPFRSEFWQRWRVNPEAHGSRSPVVVCRSA